MTQQNFTVDNGLTVITTNNDIELGIVTPGSDPGISSTSNVAIVANSLGTLASWIFDTDGGLTASGSLSGTTITLTGTGTAVNASSGNILTNKVTGTQFAFLNGLYTATLTGGGATSDYTLNLPANAGVNGQSLTSDGTGNLVWTTPASSYGNANVADFLDSLGSNAILTTGNVTGGNLITAGSVNVAGNVNLTGAEATDTARMFTSVAGSNTSLVLEVGDDNADNIVLRHYSFAAGNTIDMLTATRVSNTAANVSVAGNVNAVGGTFSGNVTAGNLIGNISITGNVTGTSPNVTLVAGSYSYTFDNTGILTLPTGSSGNEGGEIAFTQAANSTLAGNTVVIDQYVDQIRFFESGGNTRGVYIDLTKAPAGVGGELQFKASAFVNAGVDVTLGNLRARIPTSGNRSLQISTVSGTYTVVGSAQFTAGGTVGGANVIDLNVTTTPTYLSAINNFTIAGDSGHWFIMDNTAGFAWRISFIIGSSYNNNMITIERMV